MKRNCKKCVLRIDKNHLGLRLKEFVAVALWTSSEVGIGLLTEADAVEGKGQVTSPFSSPQFSSHSSHRQIHIYHHQTLPNRNKGTTVCLYACID